MRHVPLKNRSLYGSDLAFLHHHYYSGFVDSAAPRAISMLQKAGIRAGTVCDLGCGGGQLSELLLEAGYQATGIDISPAMIRLARQRVKNARFLQGSVTDLTLPPCDAAIAIGEVFNYLPSAAAMRKAFRNVFRALRSGGVFIFDIKEPLPEKQTRVAAQAGRDWALLAEIEEDPAHNRLTRTIHTFRRAGHVYRREIEIHRQCVLPAKQVAQMLKSAGFITRVLKGYAEHPLGRDRKVLLARKP
ncbi:MAG: methyltransferase domain-containing protein [Acidobacteriia bacterium]|nr:methyltransferase domain-containing protein [Terriglobia bacterium]